MRIGLDFDGVIADCGQLKTDGAKALYGVDILPAKFKKEIVIGEGLLSPDQYLELQMSIYGTRELGFLMQPVAGLLDYLPSVIKDGHEVKVITSRGTKESEIAQEWSSRYGISLEFVSLGYGNSKADAAKGLDCYVDDDLDKLEPLRGDVPNLYLFSWGYNQHIEEGEDIERVASWKELYSKIQSLGNVATRFTD